MTKTALKKIGAHVSAAGGHEKAVERAAEIGCNCLQLFSGSPRVWRRPKLDSIDIKQVFSKQRSLLVEPIFTHSLYLINLASNKPESVQKSIDVLKHELEFDSLLNGAGVVVHVGSQQGRGFDSVKAQIVDAIAQILRDTPLSSRFIIENAASRNGKIGGDLAEIAFLLDELETEGGFVSQSRLGWCLDTCHAHAAGYTLLDTKENDLPSVTETISELNLWKSLRCIHVNDSKDSAGSNRDRHENIGEGNIPTAAFRSFLQRPEVVPVPLITEAPGFDGNGPDAENITRLRELLK